MLWNALKLLMSGLSRIFSAALLGFGLGLGVGAIEGVLVGGCFALLFFAVGVAQGKGFDAMFLLANVGGFATAGMILGFMVGVGVGVVSFAVLEGVRVYQGRSASDEELMRALGPGARLALLAALCGLLVGAMVPGWDDTLAGLCATFSWSVGFFFGTLLGGLVRDAPQLGVAPLDWLLRWIWRS